MAKQDVTVELFYDGEWHDVTLSEEVFARSEITMVHGGGDELPGLMPSSASLSLKSPAGRWNPRNPSSPAYGIGRNMPARISVAGDVRFHGEAAAWAPSWPLKGTSWTDLDLGGTLRRLGQGQDPLESALRRYIKAQNPVAYWACDEGEASQFIALTAGSGTALVRNDAFDGGFEPGAGQLAPWSGRGALLRGPAENAGVVARVYMADNPTEWSVEMLIKGDNMVGSGSMTVLLHGPNADGADNWQIDMYDTEEIDVFEPGSGSNTAVHAGVFAGIARQRHWRFTTLQDGSDILYNLYIDDEVIVSDVAEGQTLARIDRIFIEAGGGGTGVAISDIVVWGDSPGLQTYINSLGWAGETAGDRFERLCLEEGITSTVSGDADDTPEMGPQHPDTLLNLFAEIERTDGGFIHDQRDGPGLVMRTGRSLYNQDPALELDWHAFHVAPPLEPVVDDQGVRNDVTAARRSGGTARAVREDGPLNVSAPDDDPEGVGRYTHQADVNPFSDLVLGDYAGWHLHRGTVDETRFPAVTVDLDATPGVDVSTLEIGDRLTIANVPAEITPDLVSLIVAGWTETIGTHRRKITYTCIPESQFHIAEVEHDLYVIVGSDGSTVNTAFVAGTGTSLSVAVAAGYPLWDDGDAPFDILVAGVRLRVTAIAGASSPQTFTVQADPVNGVRKTIAAGERVDVFHKSYIGL